MTHEAPERTLKEIKAFLERRLPTVFTGDWKPWVFLVNPEEGGTYSPRDGTCLPEITYANSYLYVGSRARRRRDSIDTHADAPSAAEQAAAPINPNPPAHGTDTGLDDLGPDDAEWMVQYSPGRKVEGWHMQALAVVSRVDAQGQHFTFVVGHAYWTWDDLYEAYPARASAVQEHFIHAHSTEHVLTDDLQVARAHHFVARVRSLYLAHALPTVPPPLVNSRPHVLVIPGFLNNLGPEISRQTRRGLLLVTHPDVPTVRCNIQGCIRGGVYDRPSDAIRYCTHCKEWAHEGCLPLGDFQAAFAGGNWMPAPTADDQDTGVAFEARPVRRSPRQDPHDKVCLPRGLWHRNPPPIDTWERAMVPFIQTYRKQPFKNVRDDSLWTRFMAKLRVAPRHYAGPNLTDGLLGTLIRSIFPPAAPEVPRSIVFSCPQCDRPI